MGKGDWNQSKVFRAEGFEYIGVHVQRNAPGTYFKIKQNKARYCWFHKTNRILLLCTKRKTTFLFCTQYSIQDAIYLPKNSSTITHKKVKSSLTEEADNWIGWRVMAHTGDDKLRCGIVSHWSKTNLTCSIMFKDKDGQWTEEQDKVPTSCIKEKAIYKGDETEDDDKFADAVIPAEISHTKGF